MRLGTGAKLFLGTSVLISIVLFVSGLWLQSELRQKLEYRIETELRQHLKAAREMVLLGPSMHSIATVDPLADRLGAAMSVRVTVINESGIVLGDSDLDAFSVSEMENHASRPECVIAREEGGIGFARRYSNTLKTDMLYAAATFDRSGGGGSIRVAMPLSEVTEALAQLRTSLGVAAIFALALVLILGGVGSHLFARILRRLILSARVLTTPAIESRTSNLVGDDFGTLAQSISEMSKHLDNLMQTLARERDQFRAVLEGMHEAVIAVNSDNRVTMVNESARMLFGFPMDPVGEYLPEMNLAPELYSPLMSPRLRASTVSEFELQTVPPQTVLSRVTPLVGSGGAVIVAYDVTEMRRLETMRRDFVANVSHELRTPVSVIRANAETLLDGALEDEKTARVFVEAVLRNSERLSNLIADLLDLSRIEAGHYEVDTARLSIDAIVSRVKESIKHKIELKNMTLETSGEASLEALGDSQALEQVLVNLAENAVKYTQEGGTLRVQVTSLAGKVRIEVEDNGPGISPEHRPRLFERFYRVDPGRSKAMGGTGLGLAIVKHLVGAMNGEVGMEPVEPNGSRFWVELPEAG